MEIGPPRSITRAIASASTADLHAWHEALEDVNDELDDMELATAEAIEKELQARAEQAEANRGGMNGVAPE